MSVPEEVVVELDERRAGDLSKVGRDADRRYLVRTEPDGTMVFTPAQIVPDHVLRLMERPDLLAEFRHAEDHPEELVRRSVPDSPDVDWEAPD